MKTREEKEAIAQIFERIDHIESVIDEHEGRLHRANRAIISLFNAAVRSMPRIPRSLSESIDAIIHGRADNTSEMNKSVSGQKSDKDDNSALIVQLANTLKAMACLQFELVNGTMEMNFPAARERKKKLLEECNKLTAIINQQKITDATLDP